MLGKGELKLSGISLIDRAYKQQDCVALITDEGEFTYGELLLASAKVATFLLEGKEDLAETRVAFLVQSGFDYVAMQYGIWRAGGVAVPLCTQHPRPELEYVIQDSQASIVISSRQFKDRVKGVSESKGIRFVLAEKAISCNLPAKLPTVHPHRRAMMLYTSGTTGRPKGVVTTHQNIQVQVKSLIEAWGWRADDHILHVLPLHHIHGIVNVLTCALWAGAICEIMPKFNADKVWGRITMGQITLFMAVPTIYAKLIAAWEAKTPAARQALTEACSKLRLMVSGSAALPITMLEKWEKISGHRLLERYGMTEIGMALSNPLDGERVAGSVGRPLPGVKVRLIAENGNIIEQEGIPGEVQVHGSNVFLEYWNRPEETVGSFSDGWFRTGDIAVMENGGYKLLGRDSVDIIKTGGYKVSALEIENILRTHPTEPECAVVGVDDTEWGQRVCAAIVLKNGENLTLESLRAWGKKRLAVYKVPSRLRIVDDLPRNTMGKVNKKQVAALFTG